MTKLPTALLALLLATAVAAPAGATSFGKRNPCQRAKTTTVAKNGLARVFERTGGPGARYDTRLFGCLRARDKKVRLADAYDDGYTTSGSYADVSLRGRFVGWSSEYTDVSCKAACPPGYEPTTYEVSVRDLRRSSGYSITTGDFITNVLVSRRGALVWSQGAGDTAELHVRDRDGVRMLDSGGYDSASLAIRGDTLTWTHGGESRSAPLGHH